MPTIASAYVHQKRIEQGLDKAARALAPNVVRIRYSIDDDWAGNPAVFFRIILSDHASRLDHLRKVTVPVRNLILDEIEPDELGLQYYFFFRSESEQAALREEAWA